MKIDGKSSIKSMDAYQIEVFRYSVTSILTASITSLLRRERALILDFDIAREPLSTNLVTNFELSSAFEFF